MAHATISIRIIASMITAAYMIQPSIAQPLTTGSFSNTYRVAQDKLYRRYVFNRRVVFNVATNSSVVSSSQLGKPFRSQIISGENASRTNYLVVSTDQATGSGGALMLRDEAYMLQPGDRPGTYKIGAHYPGVVPDKYGSAFPAGCPNMYPLMYMDAMSHTTMGAMLNYAESGAPDGPQYKLLAVRTTEWQGKPAVEATVRGALDIVTKVFLDPANDLAFQGFESDGSYDEKTRKKGPIKIVGRVTYRPSDEGFPLPAKFEHWAVLPDGKRVPQSASEVLEYTKYTPTPDDFDLEKQFGVKPLPAGTGIPVPGQPGTFVPPAPPAGRSWW